MQVGWRGERAYRKYGRTNELFAVIRLDLEQIAEEDVLGVSVVEMDEICDGNLNGYL